MFVSKKKYDALENEMGEVCQYWMRKYNELHKELDTLKASRARSNENLKLGAAASAKARRKKVVGVDWSKPVEAYHPDGRIVRGNVSDKDECGDREFTELLDGYRRLFIEDGTAWSRTHQWRIRNV